MLWLPVVLPIWQQIHSYGQYWKVHYYYCHAMKMKGMVSDGTKHL